MAWTIQSDDDKVAIQEIERESDRGMIIVGVSFLESRLENLIRQLMTDGADPSIYGWVFKGVGPLSSFYAKIELCYLFQFYPDEARKLFHKLRDLRNDAAHHLGPATFETTSIKARCENLASMTRTAQAAQFYHTVRLLNNNRHKFSPSLKTMERPRVLHDDGTEADFLAVAYGNARSSFLASIKIFLWELRLVGEFFERLRIELGPPIGTLPSPDSSE